MWLIILILIIYFIFSNKETFIVGYNSYVIPENHIDSIYDSETKFIQQQFNALNTNTNMSFDTSNFTLLNNNIAFSYNELFKVSILNFLKNKFKDSLSIQNNLHDIYFLNDNDNDNDNNKTYFIFNCVLVNSTHFFSRNIKVKIQVNNNNYSFSNINVLGIILDSNNDNNNNNNNIDSGLSLSGFDAFYPTHYQIKNTLHLLDPFITSGQDLVLTSNQITNFNNILAEKTNEIQNLTQQNIQLTQKIG
jgi:hypothetical protein